MFRALPIGNIATYVLVCPYPEIPIPAIVTRFREFWETPNMWRDDDLWIQRSLYGDLLIQMLLNKRRGTGTTSAGLEWSLPPTNLRPNEPASARSSLGS